MATEPPATSASVPATRDVPEFLAHLKRFEGPQGPEVNHSDPSAPFSSIYSEIDHDALVRSGDAICEGAASGVPPLTTGLERVRVMAGSASVAQVNYLDVISLTQAAMDELCPYVPYDMVTEVWGDGSGLDSPLLESPSR